MKKLLIAFVMIIALLGGSIMLIPLLVSQETIRDGISRQLTSISGSQVRLNGPVGFSVFPDLGISASKVAVGTDSDAISVSTERAVAGVNFFSLLSGKVKITEIRLDDPVIQLRDTGKIEPAQTEPPANEQGDVFKTAAAYLDRLSIDRFAVTNATVRQINASGSKVLASAVDLSLSAPGADETVSFSFKGNLDGRDVKLDGSLGSLRDLLNREPSAFALNTSMVPAPHPLAAKIVAEGNLQLAQNGTYQVRNGVVTLADQPVDLDVIYTPGARPYVQASVAASRLVFENPETDNDASRPANDGNPARGGAADFSFARNLDFDLELTADAIETAGAVAEQIAATASLKNGQLNGVVSSQAIAAGTLTTRFSADFSKDQPTVRGRLTAGAIDLESLGRLVAVELPVGGALSSDLQFGFRGADVILVRKTFNVRGQIDLASGSARIEQLASIAPDAETISALSAKLNIEDVQKPVQMSANLQWRGEPVRLNATLPLRDFMLKRPGTVKLDVQSQRVDGNFTGNLGIEGSVDGALKVNSASLARLLNWLGVDSGVRVGRFAYTGDVTARSGSFAIKNANIQLDETALRGSASYRGRNRARVDANLSADLLDLTKLTGGESSGNGGSQSGGDGSIDLSPLRQLDGEIKLSANQMRYGKVQIGPINTSLVLDNGSARLQIPDAGFYNGVLAATVTANANASVPAFSAKINLGNVDALPFFSDASGFNRLEGRLNSAIDVQGSGASNDALMRSLAGTANLSFADGAIRGVDVAKLVRNMQSVLQSGYQENPNERTEFTELAAGFNIQNGVATTQDLRLLGPLVRMEGSGQVDIGNQSIDMQLNPRVVTSLAGQGGNFDVSGLEVPLIVRGPLSKPRVYPDLAKLLQNPANALQTLSKLRDGLGNIGGGNINAGEIVSNQLDKIKETGGSNLVGGLLQSLSGNNNGGDANAPTQNGSGLVNNVLQGVLGQRAPSGNAGAQSSSAGFEGSSSIAALQYDVPIPTQNPLKGPGGSAPAQTNVQPQAQQQSEQPKSTTRQVIDQVLPENSGDGAGDLIEGIFNRITN